MTARPSDPVAVLESAASLLPDDSHGAIAIRILAMRIHIGATEVRHALQSLDVTEVWPGAYTPDERAAFALAREALASIPA